ncbi:MAG: hypothetical protein D8M52_03165 [Chlorobi bacterium]|nr:MAG: hypothetical protein F9K28_02445 [Bacteroidota bacterium]MBL1160703.1 hypothetical protein [Chlorobiota bacterium]MCC6331457.1 hypothetical protein [Ignavibacteria bacterium]WKZ78122.1 MAG: hypothetical protein QY319_01585 [Candidatus Kapabacteria bacterium]MCL4277105.1 hypothetical protein [Ignavibacteria bacterium]
MVQKKLIVSLYTFLFTFMGYTATAQCSDVLLLDNSHEILRFDIDTTGHWWAITRLTKDKQSLIIDGQDIGAFDSVQPPIFSVDGESWATVGTVMNQSYIVVPSGSRVTQHHVEFVTFPPLSADPWWIENDGTLRRITNGMRSYGSSYPVRNLHFDPQGLVVAWIEERGDLSVLVSNGSEVTRGNAITLHGVWSSGECIYSEQTNDVTSMMLGTEELTPNMKRLSTVRLNKQCDVVAWQGADAVGQIRTYVYAADYLNPWESPPLEEFDYRFSLSPFDPLVAYRTVYQGSRVVGYNAAFYPQGSSAGPTVFSHDGSQMVYASKDNGEYIVINGRRHAVNAAVPITTEIAVNSSGTAVAWPSSTTLVVVYPERNVVQMGKMCDTVGSVIYNRTTTSFEALGVYGGRLFKLSCKAQ